jgi:hypothetical protein
MIPVFKTVFVFFMEHVLALGSSFGMGFTLYQGWLKCGDRISESNDGYCSFRAIEVSL